jgi:hypothetical protein
MFYRHGKQPQGRNAVDISLKNVVELGLVNRGMIYKKAGSSSEEWSLVCCLFIHVKKLFFEACYHLGPNQCV